MLSIQVTTQESEDVCSTILWVIAYYLVSLMDAAIIKPNAYMVNAQLVLNRHVGKTFYREQEQMRSAVKVLTSRLPSCYIFVLLA